MPSARPSSSAPYVALHELGSNDLSFLEAALEGLSRPQKALPCRYLYDSIGSKLFERICELPEYYLSRAEMMALRRHAHELADMIGPAATVFELGSRSGRISSILLDNLDAPHAYVPIDLARGPLLDASASIAAAYPQLRVEAAWGDYSAPQFLPPIESPGRQVAFFPGALIGDLPPRKAAALLKLWRAHLGADGMMIVGIDMKKRPALLERAYKDSQGLTARFIANVLTRANRELDADFDIDAFEYEACYEPDEGVVRLCLTSTADQEVHIAGRGFYFAREERLHVKDAYKYSHEEFEALARSAGFTPHACYLDAKGLFGVHLLTA